MTKTVLHYEEDFVLYKKEVSIEKFNELLEEVKDSYIVLRYHYEHEISGVSNKELHISPLEADYIVEDKDGHFAGLYLLKNKQRIKEAFSYPETFVDIKGKFGFQDSYCSSGDLDWSEDKYLYLHHQGKDILGSGRKPFRSANTSFLERGFYLDEIDENTMENDTRVLYLDEKDKAILYAQSLQYGLFKYECGDDKEGIIFPSLDSISKNDPASLRMASFPIIDSHNKLVGFAVRVKDDKLFFFYIDKKDYYCETNPDNGRERKSIILIKMKNNLCVQDYIECRVHLGNPYWQKLAERV